MTILNLQSAPVHLGSASRRASDGLLSRLRAQYPDATWITRDLSENPPPHWREADVAAAFTPVASRTHEQRLRLELSDQLCQELLQADIIVVGAPMWNFSVPSALKAWIDHVVRVGVTFGYGASGPEGLIPSGKRVIVVQASGGKYASTPFADRDHVGPYLAQVFGFMGITHVDNVRVEGTAIDRDAGLKAAAEQIDALKL